MLSVIIVFVCVFTAVLLVASALNPGKAGQKQVIQRLDAVSFAAPSPQKDEFLTLLRREVLSSIPWLNRRLEQLEITTRVTRLLRQADVKWTAGRILLSSTLLGVTTFGGLNWRTGSALLALGLGGVAAYVPFAVVLWKRSKRFGRFEEKLPDALDIMVSAIRSGQSLISAFGIAAREVPDPVGQEFRICFDEQNFGLDTRYAILNLAGRVPIHDVQMVVTAILIHKESGGNLAEVLDNVANIARQRFRLKRQVRVHTAQGRITGWILSVLPVAIAILMYIINPGHMSKLWTHPTGLKMLYVACGLMAVGGYAIRRIVNVRV